MAGIHDQERIEALRRRLYERGDNSLPRENFKLKPESTSAPTTWVKPPQPVQVDRPKPTAVITTTLEKPGEVLPKNVNDMPKTKSKRRYRIKLILAGLGFFVLAMSISSLLLIFGGSSISGDNIVITANGPFTIGGGEVLPLQVGVTNSNTVAMQSATLIVEYPLGTKSTENEGEDLFIERLSLDSINPGETLNIPLRAVVFGEENDEKVIQTSIEYRVSGSNALFFKKAEPLRFKISSSPLVLSVVAVEKISSGQEAMIELTITSNSSNPITDILVKAEYPEGFDFSSSAPETDANDNVWRLAELSPAEKQIITIRGILVGKETDEKAMHFTVGIPSERDPLTLASVFTTASVEFEIEEPFIAVDVSIGSSQEEEIVLTSGEIANVQIDIENTLEDTIYDAIVVAELGGNALADLNVDQPKGFYDSVKNSITWDVSSVEDLEELIPGERERLTFTVVPKGDTARTPQLDLKVSVRARRVSETNAAEQLIGTAERIIKIVGTPKLLAEAAYSNADQGPVPPVSEEVTTYTLSFLVENGSNEITDTEVTASLPTYVTWLDDVAGTGEVSYNPNTRIVSWQLNEIAANRSAVMSFRVSIEPSISQINTTPTLVGEQRLKTTDNFTGALVRTTHPAVTTELSAEAGFGQGSGRVQAD